MNPAEMRRNYAKAGLRRWDLQPDPFSQFGIWFADAVKSDCGESNAMTLSTISQQGVPRGRTVLLKHFDNRGFVFFTNYHSIKAQQIRNNPWVSLLFFWQELERQVLISGRAAMIAPEESDAYFAERPRGSQLGAWASSQSEVITSRDALLAAYIAAERRFADYPVPRPEVWGGYRIEPDSFEFWQGREDRLHDRFRYVLQDSERWQIERLAP